jgi:hypothetical protein
VKSFKKFLEQNMAGPGGVFGDYSTPSGGGARVSNEDFYAPEHGAIIPKLLGIYTRKGKLKRKPKKR